MQNIAVSAHPDLLLIAEVDKEEEPQKISYRLALGAALESFGPRHLVGGASDQVKAIYNEIEKLSRGTKDAPWVAQHKLAGLCEQLLDRLLPSELITRLVEIAGRAERTGAAPTLLLLSNESWIPWELLRLPPSHDSIATDKNGCYLAEAFAFSRWLIDRPQQLALPLWDLAVVVATAKDLDSVKDECIAILGLQSDNRKVKEVGIDYMTVVQALGSGHHDSWHFCGHGRPPAENLDFQSLTLRSGEQLELTALKQARRFGDKRPLVFLNACYSGRGGFALTGIGGWGQAFLDAGAGAFIGAYWAVPDQSAFHFAKLFYHHFTQGQTIGEAVRRARLELREAFPGDPSWLAYTTFAHPLAACTQQAESQTDPLPTPAKAPPLQDQYPGPSLTQGPYRKRGISRRMLGLVGIAVAVVGFAIFSGLERPQSGHARRLTDEKSTSVAKPAPGEQDQPVTINEPEDPRENDEIPSPVAKEIEVRLMLPSVMEGADIQVDGKPTPIVEQTPTVVKLRLPAQVKAYTFTVKGTERTCEVRQIVKDGSILTPCSLD